MNATITDSRLEEMMLGEVKCAANHGKGNIPVECSYEPTHRLQVICTGADKLICQITVGFVLRAIAIGRCAECKCPVRDHWSVVPV